MFAAAIRPIFAPGATALRWAVDPWPSLECYISVEGVERGTGRSDTSAGVLLDSMTITETRTLSTPNRCSFTTQGFAPQVGDRVLVRLGGTSNPDRLFAGNVVTVQQTNVGAPNKSSRYAVTCNDDSFLLGFKKITGRYTSTSVTTIVTGLMGLYASGFTTANVETGLATLTEFTFTNETLIDVLQRLAKRIGATVYLDTSGDLHFFITDELYVGIPADLTDAHSTLQAVQVSRDISQMVTRVYVEGGGPNALSEVDAGTTTLPIQDAAWFNAVGGTVVSGPQRITYTGKTAGGGGSLVGTGASPSSAPTLAPANGAGVTDGAHTIGVVFVTGAGQSLPGPTATITAGAIAAPTTAPTPGSITSGGSVDPGDHDYQMTFVTAVGETTPSPISAVAAVAAIPTVAPTFALGAVWTDGNTHAAFTGTLKYQYIYTNGLASPLSPASAAVFIDTNRGWDATVPSTQPAGVASRRLWMSLDGGVSYTRYANLAYTDPSSFSNTSQADTGFRQWNLAATASPTGTTAFQTVPLTVPTSPLAIVTNRKIYRRFAGTGTFKLVTTLNNTVTSYNDTTANASLGADAPSSNTATANQISLSDIAIGASSVTAREIYMSPAGGGTRRLALTISNNTATTGTITMSDATLAGQAAEPTSDTSGLTQPSGQVLAGATSLPVAGSGAFPSAGWAIIAPGQQIIRYTGKSSTSLTGVPASGVGAITATIAFNSTAQAAAMLTGIPSSGTGSIQFDIQKGDAVNLLVTVNDAAAQAELAALVGGDGIREDFIQDRRLGEDEARARGQAYLDLRAEVAMSIAWRSKDRATRAGRPITVDLDPPHDVTATFKIQSVRMTNFVPAGPWFEASASTEMFTLEELLRLARDRQQAA